MRGGMVIVKRWVLGGELPKGTRPVFVWNGGVSATVKWVVKSDGGERERWTHIVSEWERDTWKEESPKRMDFCVLRDTAPSASYCSTFLEPDAI